MRLEKYAPVSWIEYFEEHRMVVIPGTKDVRVVSLLPIASVQQAVAILFFASKTFKYITGL